ncbi:MAG: glycosyl transferase family 2 [Acidimicrobiales bacterium]|nr:glycosyl transferase family 2 [Acidimicrobiales bacterium]
MDTKPTVSVVVPVKDSIRTIEACLRSIRAQTWPDVELVVIDNFSTDGTWDVVQRYAHHAEQAGPERSAQRNLAVERAKGAWVLWIDADMELPPSIVERAMEVALDEEADGVFIPEVTVGDGYWTACRALERSCCVEEVLVQSPRLVRRDYLRRTGGFLESLSGTEDAELRSRMIADGCSLAWIPDLIVHDEGRMSLRFILEKRYYYGRGLKRYKAQHPGALSGQAGAAVGAYRRHWRRLAAQPLVSAGAVLMRGGEFAAYGIGAAVGALERDAQDAALS